MNSSRSHSQIFTETPLQTKLGIMENMKIYTINAPDNYTHLLGDLPEGVEVLSKTDRKVELVHIFTSSKDTLPIFLKAAVNHIFSISAVWVSWPRDDSESDLSEQLIKSIALSCNLKDVKFTIIDEDWNGIMFRIA